MEVLSLLFTCAFILALLVVPVFVALCACYAIAGAIMGVWRTIKDHRGFAREFPELCRPRRSKHRSRVSSSRWRKAD